MTAGFCGRQRALIGDESSCLFISKKDGVASASLFQARAHAGDLDAKSVIAQTLLELAVIPGRPDRQHAVALQRGPRRSEMSAASVSPRFGDVSVGDGPKYAAIYEVAGRWASYLPTIRRIRT